KSSALETGSIRQPERAAEGPTIHGARPACDRRRTRWALRRGHSAGGDQGASGRFDDSPDRSQGARVGRTVDRRTRQPVATLETAPAYAVTPVRGRTSAQTRADIAACRHQPALRDAASGPGSFLQLSKEARPTMNGREAL